MKPYNIPVLGFAAWSGTGKTTLLKQLLPRLQLRGLRIGCIKHAHHDFDVDLPGKDSYELRHAGARQMLIASAKRWALMTEDPQNEAPKLADLLAKLDTDQLDMVLVEGFKAENYPKIELFRPVLGKSLHCEQDHSIIAVATDDPTALPEGFTLPLLDINNLDEIDAFVYQFCLTGGGQG